MKIKYAIILQALLFLIGSSMIYFGDMKSNADITGFYGYSAIILTIMGIGLIPVVSLLGWLINLLFFKLRKK